MPLMEKWGLAQIEDLNTFFSGPTGGFVRIACGIITLVIARMFFLMRGDEDTFFGFSFKREIKFYEGKYTEKSLQAINNTLDTKIDNFTLRLLYLLINILDSTRG